MSEIQFRDVGKQYGENEVISKLNLDINQGEFMVLVGPSGCAKSTTLRMIAGLESISAGELLISGKRANELPPADRNISMVFQSYALFPNMSVRENLSFGLKLRKTAHTTIESEVNRVADMLGLTTLLNRKPRQLSGGQAQRVALGRAMIRKPDAFLFDEPLSNLDAELRVQMRGEITEMQRQLRTTTVYVTHDQVEAMTMGERMAVMHMGKIMQVGTPSELYERPDNIFVAGFIGSPRMNLLDKADLFAGAEPTVDPLNAHSGTVGIRPEHLLLENRSDAMLIGTAQLQRIEDLGHEKLFYLMNTRGVELVARVGSEMSGKFELGAKLPLAIWPNRLHAFNSESGVRLQ